ncbi:MAG: Gfo/Idh/MocA family oxidoreductase [Lentisphaeria bacterium]|nr:Gfo/Idh/MocA family oxidoreductase [Lentisphaeria bacterium]
MKKIRIGIIGQGRSGWDIHGAGLTRPKLRECFQVVAVCDRIKERTEDAVKAHGCKAYTDYKELLNDPKVDLVVNSTQSLDHIPVSIEALKAGKMVLCEKPLGRHVADVEKLESVIKKTGKFFAVFQQSRFAPTYRKVLEIMNSGLLGRIVMVKIAFNGFARRWDWQTLQEMCAGSLLNTGPHPLDQALQLMGDVDPEKITCYMDRANTFGDAEDHVKLLMSAKGHPVIDLEVSSCTHFQQYVYQVYGTNGSLSGDHNKLQWTWFDPAEAPVQKLVREPLPGRAYCTEPLNFYEGSWQTSEEGAGFQSRVEKFYLNLYSAITKGTPLEVPLYQVKRQIAVIEECHRQNPLSKLRK